MDNTNSSSISNTRYEGITNSGNKPYFIIPHFMSMNAKIGDNVVLECFVTNNHIAKVAVSLTIIYCTIRLSLCEEIFKNNEMDLIFFIIENDKTKTQFLIFISFI